MRVVVNGESRVVSEDTTVASVVESERGAPAARGVAVAVDGEVVPRGSWASTALREGTRVEIVVAVQGG
jgi:sulfur carrier protein